MGCSGLTALLACLRLALGIFSAVWAMMSTRLEIPDVRVAWATSLALADSGANLDMQSLVVAVQAHESGFDPDAESPTDDHGLMQIHGRHDLCGIAKAYANVTEGIRQLEWSRVRCPSYPVAAYAAGPIADGSPAGRRLSLEITAIQGDVVRWSARVTPAYE